MSQVNVLLVDDEERFLKTTQILLQKMGFAVYTANSGLKALEVLSRQPVDVIILDVKMPGMDGMETLKAIKRMNPAIEVIMLTGHAMVDTAIEGLTAGAGDYVVKPTDLASLSQKIDMAYQKTLLAKQKS